MCARALCSLAGEGPCFFFLLSSSAKGTVFSARRFRVLTPPALRAAPRAPPKPRAYSDTAPPFPPPTHQPPPDMRGGALLLPALAAALAAAVPAAAQAPTGAASLWGNKYQGDVRVTEEGAREGGRGRGRDVFSRKEDERRARGRRPPLPRRLSLPRANAARGRRRASRGCREGACGGRGGGEPQPRRAGSARDIPTILDAKEPPTLPPSLPSFPLPHRAPTTATGAARAPAPTSSPAPSRSRGRTGSRCGWR